MSLIIDGKELKTRHCPHCGELLNKINYNIESHETGHIEHRLDKKSCKHVFEKSEWQSLRETDFYLCPFCEKTITEDVEEAIEFICLPWREK